MHETDACRESRVVEDDVITDVAAVFVEPEYAGVEAAHTVLTHLTNHHLLGVGYDRVRRIPAAQLLQQT